MDEVIKNTHSFVDILCMARGEAVQRWDEDTFHRAFKWAQYFEQVYNKLKCKPGLADKLNKYINNFNKTATVYLGTLHLSFSQLSKSKHILRTCLLQNPYLSSSQFVHVLKSYDVNIGLQNDTTNVKILEKDVTDLMVQKGTLKVLSQMRDKLTKDFIQIHEVPYCQSTEHRGSTNANQKVKCTALSDNCTSQRVSRDATGELLFNYILHVMDISEAKDDKCIHDKLEVISTLDDGMETIASCLLYLPDDCLSVTKADMVQTFILTWLLDNLRSNLSHSLWKLPVPYISGIAYKYQDILILYLDYLTYWGNKMKPFLTYQLTNEERDLLPHSQVYVWRCTEGSCANNITGTFDALVEHFVHLIDGPIHVKELCYNKIIDNTANNNNGQFSNQEEVAGLGINVWKDLCKALSIEI